VREIRISGIGCGLLDVIYPDADFTSVEFEKLRSKMPGDGGLSPGDLVFESALRDRFGVGGHEAAKRICAGAEPILNAGGPALVSLVHASQVLASEGIEVSYVGALGKDEAGDTVRTIVGQAPLHMNELDTRSQTTAQTVVLSDPTASDGHGERAFINVIGVAAEITDRSIPDEFFSSSVNVYAGTALVPSLHSRLDAALSRSRAQGALSVVCTVYDFKNQNRNPRARWPLGSGDHTYPLVDLLVCDAEEARRLSGFDELDECVSKFLALGTGAVIITDGAKPVRFASGSGRFKQTSLSQLPVSDAPANAGAEALSRPHDTTGCGDNFAGGVIANLARQLAGGADFLDLKLAVIDGIAAGAAAWFYVGGVWIESEAGEKRRMVADHRARYVQQLGQEGIDQE
jgi:sugar/nucleoside kinase (ribokinase family)